MKNDTTEPLTYDRDAVAAVLNVRPETLPLAWKERDELDQPVPKIDVATLGFELSDEEWQALAPHIPWHPVPGDDRRFLNACLWRSRAKASHRGWYFLPVELGVISSSRSRFSRWSLCGHWQALNATVQASPLLSERRKQDFAEIAAEADVLAARVRTNRRQ